MLNDKGQPLAHLPTCFHYEATHTKVSLRVPRGLRPSVPPARRPGFFCPSRYPTGRTLHDTWARKKTTKPKLAHVGHTSFIVNSRGHLLPGVKVCALNYSPVLFSFEGTWDLPTRIPAHHIDPTARSKDGLRRLKLWGICPPEEGKSESGRGSKNTDVGKQVRSTQTVFGNKQLPFSRWEINTNIKCEVLNPVSSGDTLDSSPESHINKILHVS
uniref:Protein Flattop n=1 Tax=Xiphophorus couchianus TaxID=32473 RepID=A0A3B5L065_9TELE